MQSRSAAHRIIALVVLTLCLALSTSLADPPTSGPATQSAATPRDRAVAQQKLTIARVTRDNDLAAARDGFLTAYELDPSYPMPLLCLGIIAQKQQQWDQAISFYEQYIKLDDSSDYYGQAQLRLDDVRKIVKAQTAEREEQLAATRPSVWDSPPPAKPGDTWTNSIGVKFTYIPAGEFLMGSKLTAAEIARRYGGHPSWSKDENQHRVKLSRAFLIGVFPVTQRQWLAVAGTNPSEYRGTPDAMDRPVENIAWKDASKFCRMLCRKEGKHYRLPTEAEWEYACRAGTTSEFYFGDDANDLSANAWHSGNSKDTTHPVGQRKPNAWGLYDMHGNVWQWCGDFYAAYPSTDITDPAGPSTGSDRVLRGGAYAFQMLHCRSAYRYYGDPENVGSFGVRLVVDLPDPVR